MRKQKTTLITKHPIYYNRSGRQSHDWNLLSKWFLITDVSLFCIIPFLNSVVGSGVSLNLKFSSPFSSLWISVGKSVERISGFKSWRVQTWAFPGIAMFCMHILSSTFWRASSTVSALLQLMLSEATNPVDKLFKWNSAKSKGSWQLNYSNNFCKSVLPSFFWLLPSSTCCSLLAWIRLVRILRDSWTPPHWCIDLSHVKWTDSVTPQPVVKPSLLFKDHNNTCSKMRSDHNLAQQRSLHLTVWYRCVAKFM